MGVPTMVMANNVCPHACVEFDMALVDVADGWSGSQEDLNKLQGAFREELIGMSEALASVYSVMVRNGITGTATAAKEEIDAVRRTVERAMQENGGKYEYVGQCGNVLCVVDTTKLKVHFRAKLMHTRADGNTLRDAIMFRTSADVMVYAMHAPIQSLQYRTLEDYQPRPSRTEAEHE